MTDTTEQGGLEPIRQPPTVGRPQQQLEIEPDTAPRDDVVYPTGPKFVASMCALGITIMLLGLVNDLGLYKF